MFAWNTYKAPRVDPNFICHHLNVNPSVIPKRQPPWRSSKEHFDVVKDEILKLKQASAIKEVFLSRVVGQYSGGEEEKWEMASMCGLHGVKQGLPKGSFSPASDRLVGGCNRGPPLDELFGCFLGISLDTIGSG